MKNYKQILEAINKGIQLALDDFDEDEIQNVKSKQVQNRDYTKEYLDLMNEVVDLGLPSRTLWCKYNLGVNQNQLFIANDWDGDYYAWGEIEPNKPEYDMKSYKFGNGSGHTDELTKYTTSEKFVCNPFINDGEILTQVDNLIKLQEVDDAAYQNKKLYNFKFNIPSKEQFEELIKYTTYKTTTNYKGIDFLDGGIFTSKINGKELFFPFTGWKDTEGKVVTKQYGYYWSSTLNTEKNTNAYYLNVYKWDFYIDSDGEERYAGFTIRPVVNL